MDFNHDTGSIFNGLQSLDVSTLAPLGGTAGVLQIIGTGAVILTAGTTAQRPTGAAGMLRFNTDLGAMEYHNGTAWTQQNEGTVTSVAVSGSTGLSVSGSPITTSGTIALTLGAELQGLSLVSTNGSVHRTAAGTYTARTLTGTASNIVVTNGDGVAGNPVVNLAAVTQGTTGSFLKVTLDGFGRVTGNTAVTTADITALVDNTYVNVAGDTMTGALNMGNQLITNVANPVAGTDAANKNYVDTAVTGLSWKQSVKVATTAAGTLATSFVAGTVIDGVTLVAGDRILIKNQATQSENGIYIVTAGTPTRAADVSEAAEFVGASVFVDQGTVNKDTGWVQTTNAPITVGTSNIVFAQFSGSGTYSAGTGLTLTGNTFSITSPIPVTLGGTGLTTAPANGQIDIGNGTGFTRTTLTAGTAISVVNAAGSITINNTGVTSNVAGTGISVSGATGAVTISNTGVLSVTGTASQVLVNGTSGSATTGAVTLTLPQSIATTSSVTFANVTDSALTANSFMYPTTGGLLASTAAATNGQILIGSTGAAPVAATLTAGTGVSVTNAAGSITIANTGVTSLVAGTGISISGSTGAVTVNNTGVTSVALSLPSMFTVTGSPVTTTGTLTATLASQTANTVFAAPNGTAGAPTFRSLVAADLPFKLYAESISGQTTATATATNSVALGNGAVANQYGSTTFAGGQFTAAGDLEDIKLFFRAITTSATASELFLDNAGTQRFVLPNNSSCSFRVRVTARRTDAVGGAAGYTFEGVIRKDTTSASVALTGTPTKMVLGETNVGWDAAVSADTTNGSLKITVTGEASKTIRWAAVVDALVITN